MHSNLAQQLAKFAVGNVLLTKQFQNSLHVKMALVMMAMFVTAITCSCKSFCYNSEQYSVTQQTVN